MMKDTSKKTLLSSTHYILQLRQAKNTFPTWCNMKQFNVTKSSIYINFYVFSSFSSFYQSPLALLLRPLFSSSFLE